MKKYTLFLLILICVLSGCTASGSWKPQYGSERVCEIKLVEMADEKEYTIIKEIDVSCAAALFLDIGKLSWKYYGTNLVTPRGICFLIMYDSGEYDVISYYEPKHYQFEKGELRAKNSWLCCTQEDFQDLVDKYG